RRSSPIGVLGPTSVKRLFCSLLSTKPPRVVDSGPSVLVAAGAGNSRVCRLAGLLPSWSGPTEGRWHEPLWRGSGPKRGERAPRTVPRLARAEEHRVPVSERTFLQVALEEPGQWE